MGTEPDKVADVVTGWRAVLPGLDPSALEWVGRVLVLGQHLERSANSALADHGLTLGEFDILGTLRRRGSGGMTARLTRLEARGLLVRRPDPADRRGVLVELTPKGRKLTDTAAAARFAAAERSLPPMSAAERRTLSRLLQKWLAQVAPESS